MDKLLNMEVKYFHHMRYVLALLGSAGYALLFMLKLSESMHLVHEWNSDSFRQLRQFMPFGVVCIVGLVIFILTGIFRRKLAAKWTIGGLMLINLLLGILYDTKLGHDYSSFFTFWSIVTTTANPTIFAVAMHALISKWSPPDERSLIISIIYVGSVGTTAYVGTLEPFAFKQSTNYILVASFVWFIFWAIIIRDSPEERNQVISQKERDYIRNSIETYEPRPKEDMSLGKVMFSRAFVLVVLAEGCSALMLRILIHSQSRFLLYGADAGIKGWVGQTIFIIIWGFLTFVLLHGKIISFNVARKVSSILAIVIPLPLIITSLTLIWRSVPNVCNIISCILIGARYSGALVNIIDISPNYTPILTAVIQITNKAIVLIAIPIANFLHNFREDDGDTVTMVIAGVFILLSTLFYTIWGSTAQKTLVPNGREEIVASYEGLEAEVVERFDHVQIPLNTEVKPLEDQMTKL